MALKPLVKSGFQWRNVGDGECVSFSLQFWRCTDLLASLSLSACLVEIDPARPIGFLPLARPAPFFPSRRRRPISLRRTGPPCRACFSVMYWPARPGRAGKVPGRVRDAVCCVGHSVPLPPHKWLSCKLSTHPSLLYSHFSIQSLVRSSHSYSLLVI